MQPAPAAGWNLKGENCALQNPSEPFTLRLPVVSVDSLCHRHYPLSTATDCCFDEPRRIPGALTRTAIIRPHRDTVETRPTGENNCPARRSFLSANSSPQLPIAVTSKRVSVGERFRQPIVTPSYAKIRSIESVSCRVIPFSR